MSRATKYVRSDSGLLSFWFLGNVLLEIRNGEPARLHPVVVTALPECPSVLLPPWKSLLIAFSALGLDASCAGQIE